ncbi:hypothetical protein GCM10010324_39020 [Streptomyces hiroshimensis]|uniref:DUF559 domain-containing protein n=1 Tax=Streptomyces hiroshimensis TaxID=66424 RepID=A0ABQ2YMS8_9ACTN|nr:hypothetical protein GCM10010324_39020 [Streptomyces hiroshimensis]
MLTSQAVAAGLSRGGAARSLRRAGWTRLHAGAWAEPGREADLRLRLRALQLHHPELVVSHSAAAVAHGVVLIRPCRPEFTSRAGRRRAAGAVVHRLPLAEAEVTVVSGIQVTTGVRTPADLMRALALADPASGSPAESQARLEMGREGLHPESQAEATTARGRTVRLDFLFRAEGLGIEIEGFAWHGTRAAHQNDTMRFNELAGCPEVRRVLRFTRDDVFCRPRLMIRTIRRALDDLCP